MMGRHLTPPAHSHSLVGPLETVLLCFVSWLDRDRGGCVSFVSLSPELSQLDPHGGRTVENP